VHVCVYVSACVRVRVRVCVCGIGHVCDVTCAALSLVRVCSSYVFALFLTLSSVNEMCVCVCVFIEQIEVPLESTDARSINSKQHTRQRARKTKRHQRARDTQRTGAEQNATRASK